MHQYVVFLLMLQKQIRIEDHLSLLESKLKEQFVDSEKLLQQLRSIIEEQRE
jgi:hypothetical protein